MSPLKFDLKIYVYTLYVLELNEVLNLLSSKY